MVDQHDRPRARGENEKADSFWSALRSQLLGQNYIFCNTPRLCHKPRLARVSCNLRVPAKAKSGQFLVRTQINFFRAKLRFLQHPRLQQQLRPARASARRGYVLRQKADSFSSAVRCKKYGSLNRFSQRFLKTLALIILPVPLFQIVAGRKKRTVFGPHPCPKKGANSWDFWGRVRSSDV